MTVRRYEGRAAIVSGGTSGIGAQVVARLGDEGAAVLFTGRSRERGAAVADSTGAHFCAVDQTDADAADRIVAEAARVVGPVDLLVNNAALDHTGDVLETPIAEVRELFEVNVFAAIELLQAAGRAMRGRGGAIVNVTSRLASIGVPTMAMYSASKGALLALTRGAAIELAPERIRVNAVAPGMTRTALYRAWLAEQDDPGATEAAIAERIPQGRLAEAHEVAAAIAFLGSDDAAHITGASLAVDGGYTAA
jgi:NAD(P)-dependent dehydrogenase (short-subunit alcohol dehydrogenase family)